jgi:hypothetical protein
LLTGILILYFVAIVYQKEHIPVGGFPYIDPVLPEIYSYFTLNFRIEKVYKVPVIPEPV